MASTEKTHPRPWTRNPCVVRGVERLSKTRMKGYVKPYDEGTLVWDRKYEEVVLAYETACDELRSGGLDYAVPFLAYKLVPVLKPGFPVLGEQGVGGLPDTRRLCSYGIEKAVKRWPRCGCCHAPMAYVGRFNPVDWLVPLHVAFSTLNKSYGRTDEYGYYSGVGNVCAVQYLRPPGRPYQVYSCLEAGLHSDNPGFDCFVERFDGSFEGDEEVAIVAQRSAELVALVVKEYRPDGPLVFAAGGRGDSGLMDLKPKVVLDWQLRFTLDLEGGVDFERLFKAHDFIDARPGLFSRCDDYALYGEPRSQQTPARYRTTNGYVNSGRMTPFLGCSDAERDFTYQFYVDFRSSEGFVAFGKVDGSCT